MHFKMVGTSIDSSGIQLDRIESKSGKDKTRLLLMNQIDIKGWLPASVANKAMMSTMSEMAQSMIRFAKNDFMF
jgi:hypothetical protein